MHFSGFRTADWSGCPPSSNHLLQSFSYSTLRSSTPYVCPFASSFCPWFTACLNVYPPYPKQIELNNPNLGNLISFVCTLGSKPPAMECRAIVRDLISRAAPDQEGDDHRAYLPCERQTSCVRRTSEFLPENPRIRSPCS